MERRGMGESLGSGYRLVRLELERSELDRLVLGQLDPMG
jgi:hypothetical protein